MAFYPNWDFNNDYWELTARRYVTPPTSITSTMDAYTFGLCNLPGSYPLNQGRLVTHSFSHFNESILFFHNQSPIDEADFAETYMIRIHRLTGTHFRKEHDGHTTGLHVYPFVLPLEIWFQYRITWWVSFGPHCELAVACQFEVWDGVQWVDYGIGYDEDPPWLESDLNRVGILLYGNELYFDNTEIWKPA